MEYVALSTTAVLHGSTGTKHCSPNLCSLRQLNELLPPTHTQLGLTAWILPNNDEIFLAGGEFAKLLTSLTPIILSSSTSYKFSTNPAHTLEAGLWNTPERQAKSVLMVVNVHNSTATITVDTRTMHSGEIGWEKVFESGSGAKLQMGYFGKSKVTLNAFGTVVYTSSLG